MKNIRTIFMGTGPFAVPSLTALIDADYNVIAIFTKPEKSTRKSRSKCSTNPVRIIAQANDISIYDPHAPLRTPEVLQQLRALAPEIIIVAAYGKILPQEILNLPRYGCINVHASLLPKWRGASPIHNAIRAGDAHTGITIMRMNAGLDTGDIIAQSSRAITPDVRTPKLFALLADDGATLLTETLPAYINGKCTLRTQDASGITTCHTLTRDDGRIDWHKNTTTIYNQFRALYPWPGIFTLWERRDSSKTSLRIKLTNITPLLSVQQHTPGTIFATDTYPLCIATSDGAIAITHLQREGKKETTAEAFINGYSDIYSAHLDKMC